MRVALCLALSAALSGCISAKQALHRAYGYDNGLLVRAVASIDKAWFVADKGLVLFGEVTPGRWYGDPIRYDEDDDPPTAPFIAALSLAELDSRRPRLHYSRFHAAKLQDQRCVESVWRGEPVPVKQPQNVELVDPRYVSLWQLKLDDQYIRVAPLGEIPRIYDVQLGPAGGDWLYYPLIPFAAVGDVVTWAADPLIRRIWPETPPVSSGGDPVCAKLDSLLFPKQASLPLRTE